MSFFALLVNPKDGELILARQEPELGNNHVAIYTMMGQRVGAGYLEERRPTPKPCEIASEYPLSHTTEGVTKRSSGLGTVLYTALVAMTAHFDSPEGQWLDLRVSAPGAGVSSDDKRTPSATAWWDRAVERFKLAVRESPTCDSYGWRAAFTNHLVIAFERGDQSVQDVRVIDPAALARANLGLLRHQIDLGLPAEPTVLFVKHLLDAGKRAELSAADIKRLKEMFLGRYDVTTKKAPAKAKAPRKNPAAKEIVVPKFYGPRPNPTDAAQALANARETARLRRGWAKFR